ncbi:hypothetical protein CRUP_015164 [Coryphaenoides rupestris]|nr:hypothetical protein CRUP_015164 [Coryphaenoides rupestris]
MSKELAERRRGEGNEDDKPPKQKKRKKKEKKKKKKKHKKRDRSSSASSGSASDTVYPSDLLKRAQEREREKVAPLSSRFCWLDDVRSPTELPFCVDGKPDAANWTYRRKGTSSLGLDPRYQEITWEESEQSGKKKKKADVKRRAADRYFSTVSQQLLRSEAAVPTHPRAGDGAHQAVTFLPLGGEEGVGGGETGARVPTSSANPLGVYDAGTALWAQGKGKQEQPDDQNQAEDQRVASLTEKTGDFNRRLREEPGDTRLWMEFIQYQDQQSAAAFGEGESDSAEGRRASYRAVLEKKLSVAERAVASNPTCVPLHLERLRLCRELWEPAALAKEWKKLVFLHPNNGTLWREYLLFTPDTFTVSRVNAAYGKCLSTLSAVQDGNLFVQQCHFLRQCGHSEKAVSLFQALMDFTFFKPDSVRGLPTRQQVEFFEPFWDSGEARVGEMGARGWRAWMLQQERGGWLQPNEEDDEDEEEEGDEVKDRAQPKWAIWLNVEASREAGSLAALEAGQDQGFQLRLLLSFLSFMGLPVMDSALLGIPCQSSFLLEELTLLTQGTATTRRRPLTGYDLPNTGILSRLLKEPDNRSALALWREYGHLEWLLGNVDDARKVFSTATGAGGAKGLGDPAFCDLCLLWAQLECEDGAREGGKGGLCDVTSSPAVGVLTRLADGTASSSSSSPLSPVSVLKARRSYEQALTDRDGPKLRGLVGCYALFQHLTVGVQAANAVYHQAREGVEALRGALTLDSDKHADATQDPGAASKEAGALCAKRLAAECEALAVQQTTLLRYHLSTSVFPLATLRHALTSSLSTLPHSAPLWTLYIQVENRYHSAGRARRFFHSVTRGCKDVLPRLFAIVAEQQRKQLVDNTQR